MASKKGLHMIKNFAPEDILDFTQDKYNRIVRRISKPVFATFEITNACNLRCAHCGINSGVSLKDELNTEDACRMIDQLCDAGTKFLMFIGGEPLFRKDFLEIAEYASIFLSVGINTNGILLNKEYARKLKDIGIYNVKVSFDGKSHDALRGKGSYKKALDAIKACLDVGIPYVQIEATISRMNFDELPEMIEMAKDLGVHVFEANEFLPIGRGKNFPDLVLTKEQRKRMYEYLYEKKEEIDTPIILSEPPYKFLCFNEQLKEMCFDPFSEEKSIGCGAGIISMGISANGKVMPCPVLRIEVGDLRKTDLRVIWEESEVLRKLRERKLLHGKCGRCEFKFVCGGCRGVAYAETGDFLGEDPRCWYEP
ncbi:MAG: radical SAM protein [Candidatus Syntropharchaeia archaeon]